MTGRGHRGAAALCVVLAAMTALLACAAAAPAASPPPPISITIDDGLTASDSGTALPPVVFATSEQVTTDDAALLRLALALARAEDIVVADSPSFLLGILLQRGEPISATDAVALLLGVRLEDGETVTGADAVALLLGIRLANGETVSGSDLVSLLLGIRQATSEPVGVGDDVTATPAAAQTTTTTVATSASPVLAGSTVTFTATVASGGGPVHAGSVAFSVDGTAMGEPVAVNASGVAQLTTSSLALGPHTVQASYAGTPAFLASSGSAQEDVWDYTLSLAPATQNVQRGDSVTFTVGAALAPGSAAAGLPSLSLSASTGTLPAQVAVPGTATLTVPTDTTTPLGDQVVSVHADPGGRTATAHLYVNAPPVPNAGGPYAADEGGTLALHGSATDADGDTLVYSWDVGGVHASGTDAQVTAPDGPATVPVMLTVCDDHGACASDTTVLAIANVPPAVTLTAAPSPVTEGGTFTLTAHVTDPSAADTTAGFTFEFDCGDGVFAAAPGPSASCPAVDDPGVTVRIRVTDKDGGSTDATLAVPIANVAPAVTITAPAPSAVVFIGSHVSLGASFTDPGIRDTHTASFTVGGATLPSAVMEVGGSGTASTTWTPATSGIDTLTAHVTDNAGAIGSASQTVIVADQLGFVSGAGAIGERHERLLFALEARYPGGGRTPSGRVTLAGRGVVFHASTFAWLVVAGRTATLQGTGVANGVGGYSFQVRAVDGFPNRFAVSIWKTPTGAVLLDTGAPAALAFGNVTVRG